jgi:hypothetical protein
MRGFNFNPNRFTSLQGVDIDRWRALYECSIINYATTFVDRTGNIQIPLQTATAPQMQMPTYDENFSMSYEECCQLSARRLFAQQDKLGVPIRLLYSGGIDSSMILVSLIKEVGLAEVEKRVQLVMNMDSIEENPWLWEKIIRRSRMEFLNSEENSTDWGKDRILVAGEGNDQLFGSDIYKDMARWKGDGGVLDLYWTEDLIMEYLTWKNMTPDQAETWTVLFSKLLKSAPCSVVTIADWWWWVNITCKWSCVYFRIPAVAQDPSMINQEYVDNYYYQFYNTTEHQLWSMVDREHKHKGNLLSYKYHAKELVADFLGGKEYLNKAKKGSLWRIVAYKKGVAAIDENYNFHWEVNPEDWYEPNNSFKD